MGLMPAVSPSIRRRAIPAQICWESPVANQAQHRDHSSDGLGILPVWDLGDLYAGMDDPAVAVDLEKASSESAAFERSYKGKLSELAQGPGGGERLAEAIAAYEAIEERMGRLASFAGLLHAADTVDPVRSKFYGDVQDKLTAVGTRLIFLALELNRLDDALMEEALKAPALARYRPWIDDLRLERPYQLADDIERLFHEKSVTGRGAWNRLYDETLADLRFNVDGEDLPLEAALHLLQDSREARRRAAAEALASTFAKNLRLFTLITNVLAKDKSISDEWRGFGDVAASRHLANRVEPEVVEALVAAVREAWPRLSHRYYAQKARWLGKETLEYWDRNAPLPETIDRKVNWAEARDTVLSAYGRFAPEMAAIAGKFFDRPWIDAPLRPGKSPGAFSHSTVPSAHPYVLMNYQGAPRDVMTLAHELGHGVHQVLAAGQGLLLSQTPLTLAETASVFGEMLTFRSLLERAADRRERKILLAMKVEDMLNTVVRQIAFYTFERKVHTERRNGELTAERLGEIWMDVQSESLGPAIRLGPGYETFWTYIPHFIHSPFYVYAYAFGDCLVNSLYAAYERAESGFQEKYLAMLRAGGSKRHKELLAPFGLDATNPDFWRMGVSVIAGLIDELELESA
jgi:oligoendopeptidase F